MDRRTILKSIAGAGIGSAVITGKVSADDPFEDYPAIECYESLECLFPTVEHSWERTSNGYENYYGISLVWYGSFYSNGLGAYLHGICLSGVCESESPPTTYPPYAVRGQRYQIGVENSSDNLWFGTADHRHAVYPSTHEEEHSWAKEGLEFAIDEMTGSVFGVPVATLAGMMESSSDGFSRNENSFEYRNTDSVAWSRAAHSDAILIESGAAAPTINLEQGFYADFQTIAPATWNEVEYEISNFGGGQGPDTATTDNSHSEIMSRDISPDEMTKKERKKAGIKPVQTGEVVKTPGKGYISVDYVITQNPFEASEISHIDRPCEEKCESIYY